MKFDSFATFAIRCIPVALLLAVATWATMLAKGQASKRRARLQQHWPAAAAAAGPDGTPDSGGPGATTAPLPFLKRERSRMCLRRRLSRRSRILPGLTELFAPRGCSRSDPGCRRHPAENASSSCPICRLNFRVYEDGVPQKVIGFQRTKAPITAVLAVRVCLHQLLVRL